ncbi:hypothetical protein J6590_059796 [Homalodisca vitripennis]|nr:hypothetical protein J6590_059796 [Homalodisca vitripennis]
MRPPRVLPSAGSASTSHIERPPSAVPWLESGEFTCVYIYSQDTMGIRYIPQYTAGTDRYQYAIVWATPEGPSGESTCSSVPRVLVPISFCIDETPHCIVAYLN